MTTPYRDDDQGASAPESWRYGPFPRDWRRGGLALFALVLYAGLAYFGGGSGALTCERTPAGGLCTLETRYGFVPAGETRFPVESVRGIEFSHWRGDDDVLIHLDDKRRLVFEGASKHTSDVLYDFFFEDTAKPYLHERSRPPLDFLLLCLPLCFGIFLFSLVPMFRCPGSIDVRLFEREAVAVTERWFGLPLRKRTVSLRDVTEVRVVFSGRKSEDADDDEERLRPTGLVSLIDRDDNIRPLTTRPLVGIDAHDQLAAELAHSIGCEVNRIDD